MVLARTLSVAPQVDGGQWTVGCRQEQDIIHTDAYAQNPTQFQRGTTLGRHTGRPFPWRPGVGVFGSSDSLFPNQNSFGLALDTSSYPARVAITGAQPVNAQSSLQPPVVPVQGSTGNTGGSLAPGTYLVGISENGVVGPVSLLFATTVVPSGTSTNTVTIPNIQWRNGAAASPAAFIGTSHFNMRLAVSGTYSTGSPDANGNPTTFTFTALADGLGMPDANAAEFLIEETDIWHGGVWADTIASVSGLVLTFNPPGSGHTTNQWQNYVLSLYYRPGVTTQPGLNLEVSSNTTNTITMAAAGFLAGDLVVMRQQTGSVTANGFGDPNWNNCYSVAQYSSPGLAINAEIGRLAMVIAGTGAMQPPISVASNTHTNFTLKQNWYIQPDSTSIIIIIDSTIAYSYYSNTFSNQSSTATVPILSTLAVTTGFQTLLVRVALADSSRRTAPMRYQPFREVYVPPQALVGGYVALSVVSGTVTVDISQGDSFGLQLISGTPPQFVAPIDGTGGTAEGDAFDLFLFNDPTTDAICGVPSFSNAAGAFVSNTQASITMDGTHNTHTAMTFRRRNGKFALTGQPQTAIANS